MQLVVDTGNTRSKAAVFDDRKLLEMQVFDQDLIQHTDELLSRYPQIRSSIVSSVAEDDQGLEQWLAAKTRLQLFSPVTPLPIHNLYESPETLGKDRLAAAVGAWALHKNEDMLIIDAGTAIKIDMLTANGEYLGGSIAPGLQMRFRALHQFTGKLPLVEADKNYKSLTGKNTRESILNGVQNGTCYEVQGAIDAYVRQYPGLKIVLTGGDASFLEHGLKNHIFAIPELLMIGLNEILLFNAQA
ncbi:MAG: pantothenate kinase, type [Bacteroidetes bacterium]|jgi:type III pantothenate kinase|nr:pantothenate kinase, type [Bacteroidota bacterium]